MSSNNLSTFTKRDYIGISVALLAVLISIVMMIVLSPKVEYDRDVIEIYDNTTYTVVWEMRENRFNNMILEDVHFAVHKDGIFRLEVPATFSGEILLIKVTRIIDNKVDDVSYEYKIVPGIPVNVN